MALSAYSVFCETLIRAIPSYPIEFINPSRNELKVFSGSNSLHHRFHTNSMWNVYNIVRLNARGLANYFCEGQCYLHIHNATAQILFVALGQRIYTGCL